MSKKRSNLCSTFQPNKLLRNAHLQTIIPYLFRRKEAIKYTRERFITSDDDFVDLDWSCVNSSRLCIVLHGLESSSNRGYIYGMVDALNKNDIDAMVLNNRGCSGETNKNFKSYNSGFTDDLEEVIMYLKTSNNYSEINLIGFSLGGNVALKLAGTKPEFVYEAVNKIATVSVPCDLKATAHKLLVPSNKVYHNRFLKSLKQKLILKSSLFPDKLKTKKINRLKTLIEFDDYYTAPAFGYEDAKDYYEKCSSKQYLNQIMNETIIITAKDDPFLTPECMPNNESEENRNITFLNPEKGGHVGFMKGVKDEMYWHEKIICDLL